MVQAEDIIAKLSPSLKPETITCEDLSDGCGSKFDLLVVSKEFEGKALLARHRMVNSILEAEFKTIHAMTMKCYTPEQFEKKKNAP